MKDNLLRGSAAREEVSVVVAMQGDVEHVGITVEGLLAAIAMMDVLQERRTPSDTLTHPSPPAQGRPLQSEGPVHSPSPR